MTPPAGYIKPQGVAPVAIGTRPLGTSPFGVPGVTASTVTAGALQVPPAFGVAAATPPLIRPSIPAPAGDARKRVRSQIALRRGRDHA